MVEYIWNRPPDHGSNEIRECGGGVSGHPRSAYTVVKAGGFHRTPYGNWMQLPFSYGPNEGDIKRRVQHNLCTDGNIFKKREDSESEEVRSSFDLYSAWNIDG
jgi:hypothetical protein